jgi:hypothetical protein
MLERQQRFARSHPFYWMAKQVRIRAKKAGHDVEIDALFLEQLWGSQDGNCALTGQPMVLRVLDKQGWRNQKDRLSVDRIDPLKGYTLGNVQLVRAMVNISKNAYQQPDFVAMCHQVAKHKSL